MNVERTLKAPVNTDCELPSFLFSMKTELNVDRQYD